MYVEDSESRRFEPNIRLSFSQADLGPTSAPDSLFSFFGVFHKFGTFRAHSNLYLKKSDGYLWNSNFL